MRGLNHLTQTSISFIPKFIIDPMQNTRLNRLVDSIGNRASQWLSNPWRRLSLQIIGLLLGFLLGSVISTVAGQAANWDVVAAATVLIAIEIVNGVVYRRNESEEKPFALGLMNALKIGITYSLFLEAFKLGS